MLKLADNMLLYHGSYTEVKEIDLNQCASGLDFGKGFYITSSYQQALHYIPNAVKKAIRLGKVSKDFSIDDGVVNVYRFHQDPNLLTHYFEEADADWLHFIAAHRNSSLFQKLYQKYQSIDIIGGKIADDNTSRVLNQYTTGLFGTPGISEVDDWALRMLLPNRLDDQFCFRTTDAIGALEFVRGERYGDR